MDKLGFKINTDVKMPGTDNQRRRLQRGPEEQFYGTEAIMVDGLANWFSMSQPK